MAVKNICRVINSKNALPILGDVLCMVDEQQQTITMTGSDTEAWLTYRLALQGCEGGGRFCIGADLLRDALSELPEQPVTIRERRDYPSPRQCRRVPDTAIPRSHPQGVDAGKRYAEAGAETLAVRLCQR